MSVYWEMVQTWSGAYGAQKGLSGVTLSWDGGGVHTTYPIAEAPSVLT